MGSFENVPAIDPPQRGSALVALLGGTHLNNAIFDAADFLGRFSLATAAGPSPGLFYAKTGDTPFLYVHFHGEGKPLETWLALSELGIREALGGASCGGIHPAYATNDLAVPHDFADFNVDRIANVPARYLENPLQQHTRLNPPMDATLRAILIQKARGRVRRDRGLDAVNIHASGVVAQSRGGRFETAAEIRHLRQLGCDLVTMNIATEIIFARQLGIHYAALNLVSNPAEGVQDWEWDEVATSFEQMNGVCAEIICSAIARANEIAPDSPRSLDGQRDVPLF